MSGVNPALQWNVKVTGISGEILFFDIVPQQLLFDASTKHVLVHRSFGLEPFSA